MVCRTGWTVLATIALLTQDVVAQVPAGQRTLAVQPSLSVTQTFTNNVRLASADPASDSVTRLTAGVGLLGQTGQVRGYLDYSLSGLVHARNGGLNAFQNALRAAFTADLVENRMRMDTSASISQSARSAFLAQPDAGGAPLDNTSEVRSLSVNPSFRGPLGAGLRYTAALGYTITDASKTSNGDSSGSTAAVHLEPSTQARLSWSVDASRQTSAYKAGRSTAGDRLFGTLNLRLDDQDLQLNTRAGVELSDLASARRQRYETWGLGAVWAPSPRTRLVADLEQRFFGKSHTLSLEHRTPLTVWRLSDSRSLSTGNGQSGSSGRGTAFDLFFTQFASVEPDPVKRIDLVNSFLRNNGIDPTAGADPSFLRSAATLQDRQELSVAMRGVRSSAVLVLTRSKTRRVDDAASVIDDLQNASEVRLQRYALDLSHRLTPTTSVTLALSTLHGSGTQAGQSNRQRQANVQYAARLSAESDAILGARRTLYATGPAANAQSALFATYGLRF